MTHIGRAACFLKKTFVELFFLWGLLKKLQGIINKLEILYLIPGIIEVRLARKLRVAQCST